MASNTLTLQTDIASYLGGHSVFQYVPIICAFRDENAGDALLDDLVFKHLKGEIPKNGKFGLCVVINTPEAKTNAQNAPGPIEDFTIAIQVIENKATNRASTTGTGIRADDLYETIKRTLHLYCPDTQHDLIVIRGEQDDGLPTHLRGFIIEVQSKAHVLQQLPKVALPVITVADPMMTITCATSGAAIYWTHDGSFPSAANATAALYAGSVDVGALDAGTIIRAAAYLAPLRGSNCAAEEI